MKAKSYQDASALRFGCASVDDWLDKAEREIERVANSTPEDASDHHLNAALTVAHLEDWIYHYYREVVEADKAVSISDFKSASRKVSEPHRLLTEISLGTKHSFVERPKVQGLKTYAGRIVLTQDLQFSFRRKDPIPPPDGVRQAFVRTLIEDDEIVGFETVAEGDFVVRPGVLPESFLEIAKEAVAFWRDALAQLSNGEVPKWIGHAG